MNKIASPDQFAADGQAGADWSYGSTVNRPLDAGASTAGEATEPGAQASPAPMEAEKRPAGRVAPDRQDGNGGGGADGNERDRAGGPASKDEGKTPPPPPAKWPFAIVGLLLVCLLGWGGYRHWRQSRDADETQKQTQDMVPEVRTTEAKKQDAPVPLTLPGQTDAIFSASIYPRATGYITERRIDIGSRVSKGDLLIHIAAPDLDQQLAQAEAQVGQVKAAEEQAEAQVKQAEANLNLAKVTLARSATLSQQGYETLQNRDNQQANFQSQQASLDTAQAGVRVALANTKAQEATVNRLKALTAFEDVRAPFDGVVTMRNVDLGDLVNADSAQSAAMFSIARDDVIRVTIQVPQNSAIGVRNGLDAKVEVPQMPGRSFSGTVTRSSVALVSSARTLTTEVDIPNPDRQLRPGLYVYVSIAIPRSHPSVVIPAEALIFNQHGLQVATVEGDAAKLHTVTIGRDFGTTVELNDGLQGGEQVVLSPPSNLEDGSKVKAKPAEQQKNDSGNPASDKSDSEKSNGGKKDEADQSKKPDQG